MNTNATTNTVTPSTPNPKQPQQRQTAKEIIAANVKELIAQLEAGHLRELTSAKSDPLVNNHPDGVQPNLD